MNKPKKLRLNHLRLTLTLAVELFTLAEIAVEQVDRLPPWLVPNRNNSGWWPFKPPTHQHTPVVLFWGWLSMATVAATALAGAAANQIEMLITIPVYALYAMIVLQLRQQRLDMAAG